MNKTYSFYQAATGLLHHEVNSCSPANLASMTPSGHVPIEGAFNYLCQRVELRPDDFGEAYPVVVDWQPPKPATTTYADWEWEPVGRRWVSVPTLAALERDARAERDRRMDATVGISLRAYRLGQPVPADWAAYMQRLADLPQTDPDWPLVKAWPQPPNA